jgi:flagellar hook-associated protein 2
VSTPITFSGFNDIDFNLVVNSLMQHASLPLTSLQNQQKALQSQSTNLDKLSSLVGALNSAAGGLGTPGNLSTLAGTSGDDAAVSVSTSTGALEGGYDIVVNELARSQVTVSTSSTPDATTTIVATGGSITIGGVAVNLSGGVTLQQLATAINGTAGIGVTASVIRTSPTTYQLALVSAQPGAANAFTVSYALTGGTGVTFTDTDQDNISGNSAADNAVAATDASILINNIPVTNSSNVFADVMPGVTLTARRKDPANVVRVDVATDTTAI